MLLTVISRVGVIVYQQGFPERSVVYLLIKRFPGMSNIDDTNFSFYLQTYTSWSERKKMFLWNTSRHISIRLLHNLT